MSIDRQLAAATGTTTVPVEPPTLTPTVAPTAAPPVVNPPATGSGWLVGVVLLWTVAALGAARFLGAFRRRGIVGPERMGGEDSAWSLGAILLGGVGALILGSVCVANLMMIGQHGHPRQPSDWMQLVAGAGGDLVGLVVLVVLLRRRRLDDTGLRPLGLVPRLIPTAIAGGTAALFILFPMVLVASVVVSAAYKVLHLTPAKQHPVLQMMGADHSAAVMALCVLTAVVIAPLFEETLFRGVLQTMLGRLFIWGGAQLAWTGPAVAPTAPATEPMMTAPIVLGDASSPVPTAGSPRTPPAARWGAVLVTSALFAAVHANAEPAAVFPIFVLSLGLGFVYERSGNLWMSMVCHALFNGAEIVLFMAMGK